MTSHRCSVLPATPPQTIQELNQHVSCEDTSAARILIQTIPPTASTGGCPERDPPNNEPSTSTPPEDTQNQEHQETEPIHGDSSTSNTAEEEQNEDHYRSEFLQGDSYPSTPAEDLHSQEAGGDHAANGLSWLHNTFSFLFQNINIQMTSTGVEVGLGGIGYRHDFGNGPMSHSSLDNGPRGHRGLNIDNSITDFLRFHGQPYDITARAVLSRIWGIRAGPDGSMEQNDALLREAQARVSRNGGRWL